MTKTKITPEQVRKSIKDKLAARNQTAIDFFRETEGKLDYGGIKETSFEMYVSSNKMLGMKCLIPAYEFFHPDKKILVEGKTRNTKYFLISNN